MMTSVVFADDDFSAGDKVTTPDGQIGVVAETFDSGAAAYESVTVQLDNDDSKTFEFQPGLEADFPLEGLQHR